MRLPEQSRLPDNLEIPGLYPRRRRIPRWPIGLWLIVAAVAAIPLVGIPGVVLAHYTTSNSSFCLTCHGTGETPDRSVPSEVHPNFDKVTCVDCHAKPGQIVFEGYVNGFQAEPERVSGNCARCHTAMPARVDAQGFKFNPRGITINHAAHIERGATCVTCHSNVAHDLTETRTNRPTMEACYTCHSQAKDSCAKCHANGIPAPAASREAVGRKPVVPIAPPAPQVQPGAGPAPQAAPATPKPPAVDAAVLEEGKSLYAKTCAACHGPDGGLMPSAKLNSKGYLEGYGGDALAKATAEGKGGMPPFGSGKGGPLSDEQVRAIVAYLMSAAQ